MDKNFRLKFGARVKKFRKIKGFKQDELSFLIGAESSSYVNKVENGNLNITLDKLKKLADVLGVEAIEFFRFS